MLLALLGVAGAWQRLSHDVVCHPGNASYGECKVDDTGCAGTRVEFAPHALTVSTWSTTGGAELRQKEVGTLTSYALPGQFHTWQLVLHGPKVRHRERVDNTSIPPVYAYGTWTNQMYRWDNFSLQANGTLAATQRMVGHALAPSTGFPIEDDSSTRMKGLLVAQGQPFYLANDKNASTQMYKGGVSFIPSTQDPAAQCTPIFPSDDFHKTFGQVVNTVDCHKGTGVCFFTVWKFYDDQPPFWNPWTELVANDCLYYCIAEGLDSYPTCAKIGVVKDEHGKEVCHQKGVGAVHGMTIGNTDPTDPSVFDILLVFTGKATFTDGESSMKKVTVQVTGQGVQPDLVVRRSVPFAAELFQEAACAKGGDVGGDHAWVDATGKYVWISAFRTAVAGVHMVDYETGSLLYSVQGLNSFVPNQYAYSSGIHGVGTFGQKGSYLAVATSACHDASMCAPVPWAKEVPESLWAKAILFVLDLGSLRLDRP